MEIKVGDWILVTNSTLYGDLKGKILEVEFVGGADIYPYRVRYGTITRWADGVLATDLIKALT